MNITTTINLSFPSTPLLRGTRSMLSATSRMLRIGAGRVVPRAASIASVAPSPSQVFLDQRHNLDNIHARSLSTTRSLYNVTITNPNPPLGKKNASNDIPSRVALVGARGYTGQALIELFDKHPYMDLRHVSSRELAGQELKGYTKRKTYYEDLSAEDCAQLDVDVYILALPNGVCKPYVDAINQVEKDKDKKSVIIDLSADYRFDDSWTYSLPELTKRSKIAQSKRISNPGCYATAAQLSISPLLDLISTSPTIFGISGYSGAGTKKSLNNDVSYLTGGVRPCAISRFLNLVKSAADPYYRFAYGSSARTGNKLSYYRRSFHSSRWFRGIHLTVNIPLSKSMNSRDIRNIYQDRYAGEALVKVVDEVYVKTIQNKHGVEIGGFAVDKTGKRVVICATIDNLNKGASTQCLQNMNLALGYAEFEGIPII
ncbi:Fc.00g006250.m01.CDS01 [Cosmosporella sp. VM-42]